MTNLIFESKKFWLEFLLHIKKNKINDELKETLNNIFIKKIINNEILFICKNKYSLFIFKNFFFNDFIFYLKKQFKKTADINNPKISFKIEKNSKNFLFFSEKLKLNSFTILDKFDINCNIENFFFKDKIQKELIFNFLNPNYLINDLLILGKNGVGKTYLAFSINNYFNKLKNKKSNNYMLCNSFFNLIYEIFKKKKYILLDEIKNQLLSLDLLIIDNFDIIFTKKQTFSFLCDILKNRSINNKKNIIFANTTENTFKKANLSSFCSLTIQLILYNEKMYKQILTNFILEKRFNNNQKIIFSKKAINFIQKLQINNIYELINVYKTFIFLLARFENDTAKSINEFNNKQYSTFIVKKTIKKKNYFMIEKIIKDICFYKNYKYQDLFKNIKKKKHNKIRRIITYYLREELKLTFKKISFYLKRDYSTIIRNYYNIVNKPLQLEMVKNETKIIISKINNSVEKK